MGNSIPTYCSTCYLRISTKDTTTLEIKIKCERINQDHQIDHAIPVLLFSLWFSHIGGEGGPMAPNRTVNYYFFKACW